jgi:Ala-tRNA(Pro) deacylase
MPVQKLKEFLDSNKVKYITVRHSPAYTAQELAALAHVPGKEWAKTVVVKLDGRMALAVIPASHKVVFDLLRKASGAKAVELANEREFSAMFPGCEVGAMPPFGNLFGMDVYVSEALAEDEAIAFNAGTFTELVQLPYGEFARLVEPKVAKISA